MAKEKIKLGKHGFAQKELNFILGGVVDFVKFEAGKNYFDKPQNKLTLGIKTSATNTVFVDFVGEEKDFVYPYSKKEGKSKKTEWKDRKLNLGDYAPIGMTYAVSEKVNEQDYEYDAVATMKDIYKKGDKVKVIGKLDPYTSKEGRSGVNILGSSMYFSSQEFNFEDPQFEEDNKFYGDIIIFGTEKMKDDDGNKYLFVQSKIVAYSSTKNFNFTIEAEKLAMNFSKLKDYTSIKVEGKIINDTILEEVETEDDGWGTSKVIAKSSKKKFVVYYADKDSIDTETYDEDIIFKIDSEKNNKKEAEEEFGESKMSKEVDTEETGW